MIVHVNLLGHLILILIFFMIVHIILLYYFYFHIFISIFAYYLNISKLLNHYITPLQI